VRHHAGFHGLPVPNRQVDRQPVLAADRSPGRAVLGVKRTVRVSREEAETLIAEDAAGNEWLVRLHPPGFVAIVEDMDDGATDARTAVMLDPFDGSPAELAKIMRQAGDLLVGRG